MYILSLSLYLNENVQCPDYGYNGGYDGGYNGARQGGPRGGSKGTLTLHIYLLPTTI